MKEVYVRGYVTKVKISPQRRKQICVNAAKARWSHHETQPKGSYYYGIGGAKRVGGNKKWREDF